MNSFPGIWTFTFPPLLSKRMFPVIVFDQFLSILQIFNRFPGLIIIAFPLDSILQGSFVISSASESFNFIFFFWFKFNIFFWSFLASILEQASLHLHGQLELIEYFANSIPEDMFFPVNQINFAIHQYVPISSSNFTSIFIGNWRLTSTSYCLVIVFKFTKRKLVNYFKSNKRSFLIIDKIGFIFHLSSSSPFSTKLLYNLYPMIV